MTYRSYFGKQNSTLEAVLPLAMFFFLLVFSLFFLLLYPKLFQQSMATCSHKKVPLLLGDPLRELMFEPTFKLKLNSSKLGFAN